MSEALFETTEEQLIEARLTNRSLWTVDNVSEIARALGYECDDWFKATYLFFLLSYDIQHVKTTMQIVHCFEGILIANRPRTPKVEVSVIEDDHKDLSTTRHIPHFLLALQRILAR